MSSLGRKDSLAIGTKTLDIPHLHTVITPDDIGSKLITVSDMLLDGVGCRDAINCKRIIAATATYVQKVAKSAV